MLIAIAVVIGIPVLWLVISFNRFILLKMRSRAAWADMDVQLKRRADLIPNLVEVVKGYASHEKNLFEKMAALRAQAQGAAGMKDRESAEGELAQSLGRIMVLVENYPQLKADNQFLNLQQNLTQVEEDLQYARRYYNAVVRDFNTQAGTFPDLLVAGAFRFQPLEFFQADAVNREVVKVKFEDGK